MPNYPHHLRTFYYVGLHRYFLTFCCDRRREHFVDLDTCTMVRQHLRGSADTCGFTVPAFTFMRDHLHLLVEGTTDDADLRVLIPAFKQKTGYRFSRAHGTRLWQRYGFERVLREHESTASVVRYIVENPVHAGYVTHAQDYPLTGSLTMTPEQLWELAASAKDRWAG